MILGWGVRSQNGEQGTGSIAEVKTWLDTSLISSSLILLTGPDFTPGRNTLCKKNKHLLAYVNPSGQQDPNRHRSTQDFHKYFQLGCVSVSCFLSSLIGLRKPIQPQGEGTLSVWMTATVTSSEGGMIFFSVEWWRVTPPQRARIPFRPNWSHASWLLHCTL